MSNEADTFFNVTPPIKNNAAVKCLFNVLADHTSRTLDLSTYLRGLGEDQRLILQADGAKVYVAIGGVAGTISETATGNGETVCYPVPDGTTLPMKIISGREVATGIATLLTHQILHYMTGATGVTGYLRGYRTVAVGHDVGALKAPYT